MVGNYGGKFSRADSRVSHLRSGDVEGVLFFGSTTGQSVRRAGIVLAVGSDFFLPQEFSGPSFLRAFSALGGPWQSVCNWEAVAVVSNVLSCSISAMHRINCGDNPQCNSCSIFSVPLIGILCLVLISWKHHPSSIMQNTLA